MIEKLKLLDCENFRRWSAISVNITYSVCIRSQPKDYLFPADNDKIQKSDNKKANKGPFILYEIEEADNKVQLVVSAETADRPENSLFNEIEAEGAYEKISGKLRKIFCILSTLQTIQILGITFIFRFQFWTRL